jgi:hypothetical protein
MGVAGRRTRNRRAFFNVAEAFAQRAKLVLAEHGESLLADQGLDNTLSPAGTRPEAPMSRKCVGYCREISISRKLYPVNRPLSKMVLNF